MSDEWLDFIAKCRKGETHSYDIVEGPMADDTIWDFVNGFLSGKISRSVFWEYAKFKYPTHQISFHTVNALRCLSFEQVSDELIEDFNIQNGEFDTVSECRYEVPSVISIGMLYQELVLAVMPGEDAAQGIKDIFSSFITDEISDFNSNVYYTNPDYLKCSYLEGEMLA